MKTPAATKSSEQGLAESSAAARLRVEVNGREIQVDEELAEALISLINARKVNSPALSIQGQKLLTSQQAADRLQVSRPTLISLLDRHGIPVTMIGKHRRIRLKDLELLKQKVRVEKESSFDQLIALSEELGLYSTETSVSSPNDNS